MKTNLANLVDTILSSTVEGELKHFGIKGMKWGVRRTDAQLARARGGEKKDDAPSSLEEFIKANTTGPHALSDTEVRDLITRANLLKQYDEIFNKPAAPNAELSARVAQLELAARERQAKANISSASHKRVNNFVKTFANSFEAYKKLDEATGGSLNKEIAKVVKPSKEAKAAIAAAGKKKN